MIGTLPALEMQRRTASRDPRLSSSVLTSDLDCGLLGQLLAVCARETDVFEANGHLVANPGPVGLDVRNNELEH